MVVKGGHRAGLQPLVMPVLLCALLQGAPRAQDTGTGRSTAVWPRLQYRFVSSGFLPWQTFRIPSTQLVLELKAEPSAG